MFGKELVSSVKDAFSSRPALERVPANLRILVWRTEPWFIDQAIINLNAILENAGAQPLSDKEVSEAIEGNLCAHGYPSPKLVARWKYLYELTSLPGEPIRIPNAL